MLPSRAKTYEGSKNFRQLNFISRANLPSEVVNKSLVGLDNGKAEGAGIGAVRREQEVGRIGPHFHF